MNLIFFYWEKITRPSRNRIWNLLVSSYKINEPIVFMTNYCLCNVILHYEIWFQLITLFYFHIQISLKVDVIYLISNHGRVRENAAGLWFHQITPNRIYWVTRLPDNREIKLFSVKWKDLRRLSIDWINYWLKLTWFFGILLNIVINSFRTSVDMFPLYKETKVCCFLHVLVRKDILQSWASCKVSWYMQTEKNCVEQKLHSRSL